MGVEGGQHALNGRLDHLLIGDLLDVIGPDPFEDVAEQLQLPIGLGSAFLGRKPLRKKYNQNGQDGRELQFAHQPLTLSPVVASQGSGLIGWPARRSSKYNSGCPLCGEPRTPTGSPASNHCPTTAWIRS